MNTIVASFKTRKFDHHGQNQNQHQNRQLKLESLSERIGCTLKMS